MQNIRLILFILICTVISGYAVAQNSEGKLDEVELVNNPIILRCLTNSDLNFIKNSASIDAGFRKCKKELKSIFSEDFGGLDDDELKAIFATVVAANFSEYGKSQATDFKEMARSEYLNCGNLVVLVGYLIGEEDKRIRTIGFEGGAVGNHAQLIYQGKHNILLDPTIGMVALVSFNELLRGFPVHRKNIKLFRIRAKKLESFVRKVVRSVLNGDYRPSDFLYMHETTREHRLNLLNKKNMLKSKDEIFGVDSYFSPGGISIRHRLSREGR